jgi:hypothetical protein
MQPGVDRLKNRTDGLLVETLVPFATLQVFEMAADGTFGQKFGFL